MTDLTGSRFEDFLDEVGDLEDVDAIAIKRVVAWELRQRMAAQHISHSEMANRIASSRSQLARLLDPTNPNVQLSTLTRAARAAGLRLKVEVEEIEREAEMA